MPAVKKLSRPSETRIWKYTEAVGDVLAFFPTDLNPEFAGKFDAPNTTHPRITADVYWFPPDGSEPELHAGLPIDQRFMVNTLKDSVPDGTVIGRLVKVAAEDRNRTDSYQLEDLGADEEALVIKRLAAL